MKYTEENARLILEKFHTKGWNLYMKDEDNKIRDQNKVVRENLADKLELNKHYVTLPFAKDPRNPTDVIEALQSLSFQLLGRNPTINVLNTTYPIRGISLYEGYICLDPSGLRVPYSLAIRSLDTIINTKPN